jgi:hypothetical protein
VGDGKECVEVDVVFVSGWAVQVSLYEAEGAHTVCEEVGVYEFLSILCKISSYGKEC